MDSPPPPCLDSDPTPSSSTNNGDNPINDTGNGNGNGNGNDNNRDQFLRHLTHLNKLSHKISKPSNRPSEPPLHSSPVHPPPQQQQPPVYNISKTDFRSVVQKLTGSPSHAPSSTPPTLHAPKSNSSRLQRIRPPPLAQLSTNPPSSLTCVRNAAGFGFGPGLGPVSPLPPLPTCHASAESPISAYMRFIQSAVNNNHGGIIYPPLENFENVPPPQTAFAAADMPSSPLPFGFLPSPKSPCQLLSPKLPLPLSPTVPSSPK